MKSRDFCYWLQGYFEIKQDEFGERELETIKLTQKQVLTIQKHLAMVFKHEIDPAFGDEKHQKDLTALHQITKVDSKFNC